jgi:hypothetical protein
MPNKLYIFDFDDTLCVSDARIKVTDLDTGEVQWLDSRQWREHRMDETQYSYDMSQFQSLAPEFHENDEILDIAKDAYKRLGPEGVMVMTARGSPNGPKEFLDMHNMPGCEVMALGEKADIPPGKARYIAQLIKQRGLRQVEFYDDNNFHINGAKLLAKEALEWGCIVNVHLVR